MPFNFGSIADRLFKQFLSKDLLFYVKGQFYEKEGRYIDAIKTYKLSIKNNSKYFKSHLKLFDALLSEKLCS